MFSWKQKMMILCNIICTKSNSIVSEEKQMYLSFKIIAIFQENHRTDHVYTPSVSHCPKSHKKPSSDGHQIPNIEEIKCIKFAAPLNGYSERLNDRQISYVTFKRNIEMIFGKPIYWKTEAETIISLFLILEQISVYIFDWHILSFFIPKMILKRLLD